MKLNEIQNLIRFVAKSGVSEIDLELEDFKIRIRNPSSEKETIFTEMSVPASYVQAGLIQATPIASSNPAETIPVQKCLELVGHPLPADDPSVQFLLSQRRDDGGFLEVRVAKRSGTNPTAAAIGALRTLNALPESVAQDAAEFIAELQSDEGGFQANTRMPLPDLLSTFTSCVTLWEADSLEMVHTSRAWRYGLSMAREDGGFAGFELDPDKDVEYTFYGLGLLSLLAPWQLAPSAIDSRRR